MMKLSRGMAGKVLKILSSFGGRWAVCCNQVAVYLPATVFSWNPEDAASELCFGSRASHCLPSTLSFLDPLSNSLAHGPRLDPASLLPYISRPNINFMKMQNDDVIRAFPGCERY